MRYFIKFSFKGTNYNGWQIQPNAPTVQFELNNALSTVLNENIEVTGAGRTDSGVHALQMYAHFDSSEVLDIQKFIFKLNSFLDNDIAISEIFQVKDNSNARFDALTRTYEYHITQRKDPFNDSLLYLKQNLDVNEMNLASSYLIGIKDFSSFSKSKTQTHTNMCNVLYAKWFFDKDILVFKIIANRFLRNMVRAIVGTMLDIGMGKISSDDIKKIISIKNRSASGYSVPAHALFLTHIEYPKNIFINDK